jgi:prepilin-type N-terminal cleavage/methylation domain-containing protein/prepilin-type processing-associated H-X9-DG protein
VRYQGNGLAKGRSRLAFTLVELLVVVAIIGILIALLLPAVQAAREAARRAQCQNNLKQLGLSLLNYESSMKCFPPGYICNTVNGAPTTTRGWSWVVMLLPYMEQSPLYQTLDPKDFTCDNVINVSVNGTSMTPTNSGTTLNALVGTSIGGMVCPTDQSPTLLPNTYHSFGTSGTMLPATSNYIGVMGLYDDTGLGYNDGFLPGGNCIKIRDIIDGTSNTMAVGERDKKCNSAIWFGVKAPMSANPNDFFNGPYQVLGRVSVKQNDTTTSLGLSSPPGSSVTPPNCSVGFGSSHVGGAQFAFADGSVHFISDGVTWVNPTTISPSITISNGTSTTVTPLQLTQQQALGPYEWLGMIDSQQPKSSTY